MLEKVSVVLWVLARHQFLFEAHALTSELAEALSLSVSVFTGLPTRPCAVTKQSCVATAAKTPELLPCPPTKPRLDFFSSCFFYELRFQFLILRGPPSLTTLSFMFFSSVVS